MPRIELIGYRKAGPELRQAYKKAGKFWGAKGGVPIANQILQCFSHRPAYVEAVAEGYYYAGWGGVLPRTVRELAAVLVSRENDCFY